MKKIILYAFPLLMILACGKDDIDEETQLNTTPLYQLTGFGKKYTTLNSIPIYATEQASPLFQDMFWKVRKYLYDNYGGRQLESFDIVFVSATRLTLKVYYRSDSGIATATYDYSFDLDNSGLLSFAKLDTSNANGTNLRPYLTDFLDNYLEAYKFKLDWIDNKIPGTRGTIAAYYRSDEPSSYFYGTIK